MRAKINRSPNGLKNVCMATEAKPREMDAMIDVGKWRSHLYLGTVCAENGSMSNVYGAIDYVVNLVIDVGHMHTLHALRFIIYPI